jgi:hypothetical protein
LFSALALSCAKVENEPSDPVTGQPEGELTIPENELIPGAFRAYTSGDTEGEVKDDVKAYPEWIGGDIFVVKWKKDDKLKVFYDRTGNHYGIYSLASGAGTSLGQFTLFDQNAEETGTYYAVSPAEAAKGIQSDGSLLFNIPDMQNVTATGATNCDHRAQVMIAQCGADKVLKFKQVCSFIRLKLPNLIPGFYCYKVEVESATSNIVGDIKMNYYSPKPTLVSGQKKLTVNVAATNFGGENDNYIYFYLASGTYSDLVYTMYMRNAAGAEYTVVKSGVGKTVTLKRANYHAFEMDCATNLSASSAANCYLIKTPGVYYFDVTKMGNGVVTAGATAAGLDGTLSGVNSVAQYYSDGPNSAYAGINGVTTENENTTDGATFIDRLGLGNGGYFLSEDKTKVYFKTAASLTHGTSLVSVKDESGKTLWSWHIWSNPTVKDVTCFNATFMSACLGAHHNGETYNNEGFNGYYYQWGRKDPFQQAINVNHPTSKIMNTPFVSYASAQNGTLALSIANPHTFYGGYRNDETKKLLSDWAGPGENNLTNYTPYYDWWCKGLTDASVAPSTNSTTINNPINFTAAMKTMFDPCPPGYHVPALNVIFNFHGKTTSTLDSARQTGCQTVSDGTNTLYFPGSSARSAGISPTRFLGVYLSETLSGPNDKTDNNKVWKPSHYCWSCTPGTAEGEKKWENSYAPRTWVTADVDNKSNSGYNATIHRAIGSLVRCQKN